MAKVFLYICDLIRRMNILNELHSQIAIYFFIKGKNKKWPFKLKIILPNQVTVLSAREYKLSARPPFFDLRIQAFLSSTDR